MARRAFVLAMLAAGLAAGSAASETSRSRVLVNTGAMQPADGQPVADAVVLTYPIAFSGGDLDGCTASITETLFDHAEEGWGIFRVRGEASCPDGGFRYESAGAYDGEGLHGSGDVVEGSGTGRFAGLSARVAQLGGSIVPAASGDTFDVSFEFVIDPAP